MSVNDPSAVHRVVRLEALEAGRPELEGRMVDDLTAVRPVLELLDRLAVVQ